MIILSFSALSNCRFFAIDICVLQINTFFVNSCFCNPEPPICPQFHFAPLYSLSYDTKFPLKTQVLRPLSPNVFHQNRRRQTTCKISKTALMKWTFLPNWQITNLLVIGRLYALIQEKWTISRWTFLTIDLFPLNAPLLLCAHPMAQKIASATYVKSSKSKLKSLSASADPGSDLPQGTCLFLQWKLDRWAVQRCLT